MKLRMLVSYYFYRDTDLKTLIEAFPEPPDVFADSGAYSAYTLGGEVTVDGYAEWVNQWKHYFTAYANLDVIQNPKATLDNQRALESLGLTPLPVFHGGDPWEYYEGYLAEYPWVCLGGMVARDKDAIMRWLVKAFTMARDADVCLHGFGQTNHTLLSAFPWYSVDSSSWTSGHRWGTLDLWDEKRARFVKASIGKHASIYKHAALIRAHGGDPEILARPDCNLVNVEGKDVDLARSERQHVIAINVRAWLMFEQWLRRRHGPIGPPRGMVEPDHLRVYLADSRGSRGVHTETPDLGLAAQGLKLYLSTFYSDTMRYLTGPKIYIVDGYPPHLVQASKVAAEQE